MSDPKDIVAPVEVVEAVLKAVEPKAKAEDTEPHWLNARLERERAATLKKAGFESLEEAQASSSENKAKREAEKTAAEKAAETSAALKKSQSKEKALSQVVAEFAASQLVGLTDEQKAAVLAVAGDDAADQLKALSALKPTWAKATETAPAALKAVDTAPPANAPSQASTSETNHRAQYEALRKSNPFAAAEYGRAHSGDVFGDGT